MRLIDADALFEVIKKSMAENPHKEETQRAMHIHEHKYFLTLLTSFPTIQHEERTEKRMETHACDLISRQAVLEIIEDYPHGDWNLETMDEMANMVRQLSPAQPEDYTELKREFLRMASYIDVLLECSDEQKETLNGFISRLAEFMPWIERD